MKWDDFKKLVKELRLLQDEILKRQRGCNKVMLQLSVIDENDYGRIGLGSISFTPHAINLTTGMVFAYHNSLEKWTDWNVKNLLLQEF